MINRPYIKGWDHGRESEDLMLKPSRRQPIVTARVAEPAKSILRILEFNDRFFISCEIGIETFSVTIMNEKANMGI